MIITVTLNPSVDRTVELDVLHRGRVCRAHAVHLHPGGKGVNVTRALSTNGVPSRAIVPAAGAEGEQLIQLLRNEKVEAVVVPVAGRTRCNITIAEADGTITKLNEPGSDLTSSDLEVVLRRTLQEGSRGDWIVLSGSLPPGVAADHYGRMTQRLLASGFRVAVDTSGPALLHAVAAGPDLIKPNTDELAEAVGRPITCIRDVVAAARHLQQKGARRVLVSLAEAGAVLVDEEVLVGDATAGSLRSSVGAGDALLAGFLAAETTGASHSSAVDESPGSTSWPALAQALAWGSAAVALPGSQMPAPADIRLDRIRQHPQNDRLWDQSLRPTH